MRSKKYLKQFDQFFNFIENGYKNNLKNENKESDFYSDSDSELDFDSDDYSDDEKIKVKVETRTSKKTKTKTIEERFWITLFLLFSLLILFLILTDQKQIIDREILLFKASQTHLYKELNHIFTGKQTQTEPEIKVETVLSDKITEKITIENGNENENEKNDEYATNRAKYDQFAARKEFQLDWNSLTHKPTTNQSESMEAQLQEVVKKIEVEQQKIYQLKKLIGAKRPVVETSKPSVSLKSELSTNNITFKSEIPTNKKTFKSEIPTNKKTFKSEIPTNKITNPFSDLKELKTFIKQISPINPTKPNRIHTTTVTTNTTSQSTMIKNLNFSYARIIRLHFARQLGIPETDLKSPNSLPHKYIQQIKFLVSVKAVLDALPLVPEIETKRMKLQDQIAVHLATHNQPLKLLSSSLKSLFNSLIRNIDDIPPYPVAKSNNHKQPTVLLKRSPRITEGEAYSKIFNRLYKLNRN